MKKIVRACTVAQSLSFVEGLLPELATQYEVILLSSPGEELEVLTSKYGVRSIPVPMERHITPFKDVRSLFSLIRVFRRERPDIVHSITPKAGLLCMLAAWWTKVPVRIHTFTGLVFPTSTGLKRKVLMFTDKITCKCATHIIPEGEGVKHALVENNITNKPLEVLGYGNIRGVDMTYYDRTPEVREKALLIRDPIKFTFLYVGRIVSDKGINELVNAFIRLYHTHPNTRLVLVGSYEDNLDPIDSQTRDYLKQYHDIVTVGVKKGTDLLAYYAASDCFVLPSYREGFPNTVLEAGALGLPCIVTDVNGSREIIKDGYNGLIVPSHDIDALFSAMKEMVDQPEKRGQMASVARNHIASHYEQGFVNRCQLEYYYSIIKES